MKNKMYKIMSTAFALLLLLSALSAFASSAKNNEISLGDMGETITSKDVFEDKLGLNTAHSGEPIKIGKNTFKKGVGFHCLPDRDAYVEFDISECGMSYFSAYVGVLSEASYFLEWGSISFHVYGDGELLASSPVQNYGDAPYFLTCSIEGVQKLRLVQKNDGSHACDAGVWGNARLTAEPVENEMPEDSINRDRTDLPQPEKLVSGDYAYVSDLYWMDNATYSGNKVGRDCTTANEIILSSDGVLYQKGVGFHAVDSNYSAFAEVNIEGLGFTKFVSHVGVTETLTSNDITMASVKFAVFGDGILLAESHTVKYGSAMETLECDITGVKVLRIAVAGAPGIAGGWGTFGGALLSKSGKVTDDLIYYVIEDKTEPETEKSTEPESVTEPESISEPENVTTLEDSTTDNPATPDNNGCTSSFSTIVLPLLTLSTLAAAFITKRRN